MRVVPEFRARFGADPYVVGSAPGRVNLIGEHLDYNGGRSLPIALEVRTFAAAAPRADGLLVVESLQTEGRVEVPVDALDDRVQGWAAYVAGVVWALGLGDTGYSILVDGQVPTGAGLSSSAALECAVAMGLRELAGSSASLAELVAACVRAENEYVGANTGSMDQTVALFAEPGHALLIDFATGANRPVPWHPPGELLVIDTRATHALVDGEYADRRKRCEEAAAELGVVHLAQADPEQVGLLTDLVTRRRAHHVVTEYARVVEAEQALRIGDWEELGRLMTASHASLRDDYEVSVPELDVAVEAALEAGALGARMTGGGFGGSAIALVPPGLDAAVRDAVLGAYAAHGWEPPRFLSGTAGGAASLERLTQS
jgi:galactokinase